MQTWKNSHNCPTCGYRLSVLSICPQSVFWVKCVMGHMPALPTGLNAHAIGNTPFISFMAQEPLIPHPILPWSQFQWGKGRDACGHFDWNSVLLKVLQLQCSSLAEICHPCISNKEFVFFYQSKLVVLLFESCFKCLNHTNNTNKNRKAISFCKKKYPLCSTLKAL